MPVDLNLIARLMAYENRAAQRTGTHRRVSIQPHAMVLAPLTMAGENGTLHALAMGGGQGSPEFLCVPDPRVRDEQFQMLQEFGRRLQYYFEECEQRGVFPQVWVSSPGAVELLDLLSERFRHNPHPPELHQLSQLLSYWTEGFPVAGQQALQVATDALKSHWATGQQPSEDEHLGTLLTWIQPPEGLSVFEAAARAALEPMGVKTRPEMDRQILQPLVTRLHMARRKKAAIARQRELEQEIRHTLLPVAKRIFQAIQKAIHCLQEDAGPPLSDLPMMERQELQTFRLFQQGRQQGRMPHLLGSRRLDSLQMVLREAAAQSFAASLLREDGLAQSQACLRGEMLAGVVKRTWAIQEKPRKTLHFLELSSEQSILRLRKGDELYCLEDARLKLRVLKLQRDGVRLCVKLQVLSGQRAVGIPDEGCALRLTPKLSSWKDLPRIQNQASKRLWSVPVTDFTDAGEWTEQASKKARAAAAPSFQPSESCSTPTRSGEGPLRSSGPDRKGKKNPEKALKTRETALPTDLLQALEVFR